MTRKKYAEDTFDDRYSDIESSSDEEEIDVGFYDEDVAWKNIYDYINEYGTPTWMKHYIPAEFLLELILSYDIDYYPVDHLRFSFETNEDLNDLRENIYDMIEMCAVKPTLDHIETVLCAMLTERAKFYVIP